MLSAHDVVTCMLVYTAIGSLVWVALYSAGIIQKTCANLKHSRFSIVLASIATVIGWPVFGWVFAAGLIESRRQ